MCVCVVWFVCGVICVFCVCVYVCVVYSGTCGSQKLIFGMPFLVSSSPHVWDRVSPESQAGFELIM